MWGWGNGKHIVFCFGHILKRLLDIPVGMPTGQPVSEYRVSVHQPASREMPSKGSLLTRFFSMPRSHSVKQDKPQ